MAASTRQHICQRQDACNVGRITDQQVAVRHKIDVPVHRGLAIGATSCGGAIGEAIPSKGLSQRSMQRHQRPEEA